LYRLREVHTYVFQKRQYGYLEDLLKRAAQAPLEPNISKFIILFRISVNVKPYPNVRKECEEISGFCK
jgi:hypothetical protein